MCTDMYRYTRTQIQVFYRLAQTYTQMLIDTDTWIFIC